MIGASLNISQGKMKQRFIQLPTISRSGAKFSLLITFITSLLFPFALYGAEREREISILRLSTSELDRAISDLLCLSYEVIHPLYSCSEGFVEQERFTEEFKKGKKARAARRKARKEGEDQTPGVSSGEVESSTDLQSAEISEPIVEEVEGLEGLKRLALQQNNPELWEFDFIITSEQYFNEVLKGEYQLLLPLYQKAFTAITRSGAANEVFDRDNIFGVLNQDFQLEVARNVLSAVNLKKEELVIGRYKEAEMMEAFCQFDINVAFVTGTHPDSLIRKLNTLCDGKPVSIARSLPKDFFQRNRYLYRTTIAKEYYWRLAEDIETLSARYLLAVNKDLSAKRIEEVLGSLMNEVMHESATAITAENILRNYENLQTKLHPLGELMIRRDLLKEEIEVPEEKASDLDQQIQKELEILEGKEIPQKEVRGVKVLEKLPSLLPEERATSTPAVLSE